MSITSIPHSHANVKTDDQADVTRRWRQHKHNAQIIALRLMDAGYQARGERMSVCSDIIKYRYCQACDTWHVERANLCRDRLCPTCQWRLALRRYAVMQQAVRPMVQDGLSWALITLTVRNCWAADLGTTIDTIMQCWHRVLQRKDMRKCVGWARSLELTYNADSGQVHPHMHVLAAWADGVDHGPSLRRAWLDTTCKAGLITDASAQHSAELRPDGADGNITHAILETYKYSIKGSDLLDMPTSTLREVAQHWGGRRLMALGGLLRTAAGAAADDLDTPDDTPLSVCRTCGNATLDQYIARWSMGDNTYRMIRLHDTRPAGLPDLQVQQQQPQGAGADRPPDMPVLIHTINGDMIMYPGGAVTRL